MKYNNKIFDNEVKKYTKIFEEKVKGKTVFIVINLANKKAFYSLAPLSRAVHNLGGDMHILVNGRNNFEIVKDVWYVYKDYKRKLKTKKVKALKDFIKAVNKRTKKNVFEEIFRKPEFILKAEEDGFSGTIDLPYYHKWHKRYRWKEVLETAKQIWRKGYNLKKKEKVTIGFVLTPAEKNTELPLEDYLDSFSIAMAMAISAKRIGADVGLNAHTNRFSLLAKAVRSVELMATLKGCEWDKDVDEDVFKRYNVFSKLLKINRLRFPQACFGIHAKGYYGRHFFGEEIGYPTLDKKTRWSSPGQMMLKDVYSPQTALEKRDPMMRYAVTETLPIDIFIESCNIDYIKLRKKSDKIGNILNKCDLIRVIGKQMGHYKTDFTVYLVRKDGRRKEFISSDCDVRSIIDNDYYKKTGIKAGAYANFPSGEAFVTPAMVKGLMIGDVVINIDRSYVIPEKSPIIVEFNEKGYKIIKVPKHIKGAMKKELAEGRQKIRDYEKNRSLPKEIIRIYKKNFKLVGEFAVNTNPKARLSNYLIVNEKIARMIHVALGLGFEPDRKTVYHWDIVVNSPKQRLDIYGIDKNKKIRWIIKEGKFVV